MTSSYKIAQELFPSLTIERVENTVPVGDLRVVDVKYLAGHAKPFYKTKKMEEYDCGSHLCRNPKRCVKHELNYNGKKFTSKPNRYFEFLDDACETNPIHSRFEIIASKGFVGTTASGLIFDDSGRARIDWDDGKLVSTPFQKGQVVIPFDVRFGSEYVCGVVDEKRQTLTNWFICSQAFVLFYHWVRWPEYVSDRVVKTLGDPQARTDFVATMLRTNRYGEIVESTKNTDIVTLNAWDKNHANKDDQMFFNAERCLNEPYRNIRTEKESRQFEFYSQIFLSNC